MLKQIAVIISFGVSLMFFGQAAAAQSEEVDIGDTRDEVTKALGKPQGNAVFRDIEVLYFKRGQVDIKDDKVVSHTILSEEEFETLEAKRELERLRRAEEANKQKVKASAASANNQPPSKDDAEIKAAEARRQAKIDKKVEEGMHIPPIKTSGSKFRRYRRGRSPSAVKMRDAQLREKYEKEIPKS